MGDVVEADAVLAGVGTEESEGAVDSDVLPLRDHALGLLDEDPRIQSVLQLRREIVLLLQGLAVHQRESRDIGERLHEREILTAEGTGILVEQVQRAEGPLTQTQRRDNAQWWSRHSR
jgi:hypothetical protein